MADGKWETHDDSRQVRMYRIWVTSPSGAEVFHTADTPDHAEAERLLQEWKEKNLQELHVQARTPSGKHVAEVIEEKHPGGFEIRQQGDLVVIKGMAGEVQDLLRAGLVLLYKPTGDP